MWLFTDLGFYSVVRSDVDPSKVLVRTRWRSHLRNLQDEYVDLADLPIEESDMRDYQFRMIVDASVWADVAYMLATDVDYSNFKAARQARCSGDPLNRTLSTIWSVLAQAADRYESDEFDNHEGLDSLWGEIPH